MDKVELKTSEIDWIGLVPSFWKKDKLFRLCDKMGSGGTPRSTNEDYYGGDIPWIQSGDLTDGYVSETEKKITDEALSSSSAKMFPKGTLLVAMYGATIGKLGIMEMDAATNQACCALQLSKKLNSKYAYYLMLDVRDYLITQSYGGGQPNISQEILKQLHLFYSPLPEQKAIADYLDKACKRIDSIIEIKQKQLERIKTIRKSKIDELVCFGNDKNKQIKETGLSYLPEINKKWNIDRFKDVARLRNEKTDEKSDENNYLELEDIDQGTGNLLSTRNTLEVESKVTKFYKGDVLFGKLRPYLEKYHYAEFDGKCTGEILALEPFRINGKFLMYLLASKWFIDLCNSMAYGAKMPRVNWNTQLAMVYFPLPSKAEQETIVQQLDILSEKTHKLKEKLNEQITTLQTYRKSLIHECVTGKKQVWEGVIETMN